MSGAAKRRIPRRRRLAMMAAAVTAVPLVTGAPALVTAPDATAALPEIVTLGLYPGRNSDDDGGIMCTGSRACEPLAYPYLERKVGADILQDALTLDTAPEPVVVFGYSQGARVVTQWLEDHAGTEGAPSPDRLSFMLIGNPDRRYGGAHAPLGQITPDTEYDVIDVSRQYDRASDLPDNPFNVLAFLNASAGLRDIHMHYEDVDIYDPANYVWKEGNITYVFVPTENIPLLDPLRRLGLTDLADKLNGPLKAKIEEAYDRSYLPATPGWPAELLPPKTDPPQPDPAPTTLTAVADTAHRSRRGRGHHGRHAHGRPRRPRGGHPRPGVRRSPTPRTTRASTPPPTMRPSPRRPPRRPTGTTARRPVRPRTRRPVSAPSAADCSAATRTRRRARTPRPPRRSRAGCAWLTGWTSATSIPSSRPPS
ncbi:PE-PPE domain-containing protein [Mycobacterium rufum]|uniref:PE-PPE domain-containing protein n=1 Tax=Mycolicibacterium rufum TaxID=318424 RepID=A0A9X3BQJ1_9MYCO|nr:PE-PPE domain-containing protein [Mycolicibacterium rufum]